MKKKLFQGMLLIGGALAVISVAFAGPGNAMARQNELNAAFREASSFTKAWDKTSMKFTVFAEDIRRQALLAHCLPEGQVILYMTPGYNAYFNDAGDAMYDSALLLRKLAGVGPMRWVAEQLTDAEYEQSMRALTSPELAEVRAIRDVRDAMAAVLESAMTDVSTGEPNVPLLIEFKETLARTDQLARVVAAIRSVNPAYADTFLSLHTMWPIPAETWKAWSELALMLNVMSDIVEQAYIENLPADLRARLSDYERTPAVAKFEEALASGPDIRFYPEKIDSDGVQQMIRSFGISMDVNAKNALRKHRGELCEQK